MEILGIKFAPLNIPLERRLQTLVIAIWILVFPFGDFWGYIITAYLLLYTQTLRYFMLLYFLWMYYDWNTCDRGGRRKLYPGLDIRLITLDQHFKIPLFREIPYSLGCCAANAKSIEYLLSTPAKRPYTGRATILIVGGVSESMESLPGTYRIVMKKRKGFVKLALKHGTPLVPVLSFGETDLYNQVYSPEGSTLRRIQNYIRNVIGLAPVIFSGRGLFQYSFGLIPNRLPVTVVVGRPLELPKIEKPTAEQIDEHHKKFMKHLIEFFETQKYNYIKNAETTTLEIDL
ncbi:Diacylglycerol O-acyltransferase [Camponotus floridanus]|uniref:Diacylglycerol O-acyltransferase n=1 Tax=Camponotus floridanus TaxID=104421 RepID=E2AAY9_CAMFO|nr:Diacylglycerol O-acyltransferase [Camponotus floridanus]